MSKRSLCLGLVIVLLFTSIAFAASNAYSITPSLSFTGTIANCQVVISAPGKDIDVTMELYNGSTRVGYWHKTATSYVNLNKTKPVSSGNTYTLEISGTIDGEDIDGVPVTKTCP